MPDPPTGSMSWVNGAAKIRKLAIPVSAVVGITAISGAFVAGNDAVRLTFSLCVLYSSFYLETRCTFYFICLIIYDCYEQGHAYNSFPKMGDTWIPEDIFCMEPFIRNFFENTATVQVTFFPLMISLQICSCLHEKGAQLQKIMSS